MTAPTIGTRAMTEKYWVLSRAHYVVRIVDFNGVPVAKRAAALLLAQTAWTPFVDTAHYVIPQSDGAMLCAYNFAAVQEAQAQIGIDPATVLVIPETALWTTGAGNAHGPTTQWAASAQTQMISVTDALDGVVATVVDSSRVVAEQWWPARPAEIVWLNFQRGVGVGADTRTDSMPTATKTGWRPTPIGFAGGSAQNTTSQRERWVVALVAWLLVIPTIWFANDWRQLHTLKIDAISKLAATESELDATLGARGQALNALDRANKLAGLFGQPDSLTLFALVNDVLAQTVKSGVLQLVEWDLRGPQLKFVMIAPAGGAPAATAVVKAFEKISFIRDVEVNADGARTSVSLRIAGATNQPPLTDVAPNNRTTSPAPIVGTGVAK